MSNSSYKTCPDIAAQEKKKKQLYLKDNIMTVGYDPDDFATFLEDEKEGGTDIENWTYEELESLVHVFRKSRDRYAEEEDFNSRQNHSDDSKNKDISGKINDPNSAILSKFYFEFYKEFFKS